METHPLPKHQEVPAPPQGAGDVKSKVPGLEGLTVYSQEGQTTACPEPGSKPGGPVGCPEAQVCEGGAGQQHTV